MTAAQIRYAVVGLGYISQAAMLPAFRNARRNSRLAALVSGDRSKRRALGRSYGVEVLADYDGYEGLLKSGDVDAVYIGLPNSMHRDFAVRALNAGVHVLCDKPLGLTLAECKAMVAAARRNSARLMTAYRLHFEPANLTALRSIAAGQIGEPRFFSSDFAMQVKPGNIRTQGRLGGGPLFDLGIYCINAARHVFRAEPVEIHAQASYGHDARFRDVEEMAQVTLRFPGDRLASFTCSFGAASIAEYRVRGTKGALRLEQAYNMVGSKKLIREDAGGEPIRTQTFGKIDQFAPLIVHFSDSIRRGRNPFPSGEEGMADIRVLQAIQESLDRRRPVRLGAQRFISGQLEDRKPFRLPGHGKPDLVKAAGPSQ